MNLTNTYENVSRSLRNNFTLSPINEAVVTSASDIQLTLGELRSVLDVVKQTLTANGIVNSGLRVLSGGNPFIPRLFFESDEDVISTMGDFLCHWYTLKDGSFFDVNLWTGWLSSVFHINRLVARLLVIAVKSLFSREKESREEQACGDGWSIKVLLGLIVSGFFCRYLNSSSDECTPERMDGVASILTKVAKELAPLAFVSRSLESFIRVLRIMFDALRGVVELFFGQSVWFQLAVGEDREDVVRFCEYMLSNDNEMFEYALTSSKSLCEEFMQYVPIYDKWVRVMAKLEPTLRNHVVAATFWRAVGVYRKLLSIVKKRMAAGLTCRRRDPFCVYIGGKAGVGKSHLVSEIVLALSLSGGVNIKDCANLTYVRTPASAHYDGYTGQFAMVREDIFQARESTEAIELILEKSINTYLPPMAHLEHKAMPFTSELIVCTSNTLYPKPAGILDYEALWRRRDVTLEMVDRYHVNVVSSVDEARVVEATFRNTDDVLVYLINRFQQHRAVQLDLQKQHEELIAEYAELGVPGVGLDVVDAIMTNVNHVESTNNWIEKIVNDVRRSVVIPPLNSLYENCKGYAKPVIALMSLIGVGALSFGFARLWAAVDEVPTAYHSGRPLSVPRRVIRSRVRSQPAMERPVGLFSECKDEFGAERNSSDFMSNLQVKSWLVQVTGGDMCVTGTATRLVGQWFITVAHLFPVDASMYFVKFMRDDDTPVYVTVSKTDVRFVVERDLCFFRIRRLNNAKDLRKRFMTFASIVNRNGTSAATILPRKGVVCVRPEMCLAKRTYELVVCGKTIPPECDMEAWITEDVLTVGDSGSLLVDLHGASPTIIGIGAGACVNRYSRFIPISREEIYDWTSSLEIPSVKEPSIVNRVTHTDSGKLDGTTLEVIGELPLEFQHRAIGVSKLKESLIHGKVEPVETGKPVLHAGDRRVVEEKRNNDPLLSAVSKYGAFQGPIRIDVLDEVFNATADIIATVEADERPRVWTMDEAINGVRNEEGVISAFKEGLNFSSSAGFGYPSGPKKKVFDQTSEGKYQPHDIVTQNVEALLSDLRSGVLTKSVWTDCLKDEKKDLEAICEGKTRSFCIPPVHWSIVCKMYFGDFLAMLRSSFPKTFSCVGINPESADWNLLYSELLQCGDMGLDIDFKNFDGKCVYSEIVERIGYIIEEWYGPCSSEAATVRQLLLYEMTHATSRAGSILYRRTQGNPSGSPVTTEINTLTSYMLLMYVWIVVAERFSQSNSSCESFMRKVKAFSYGDDLIMTVDRSCIGWFTIDNIRKAFDELGIMITSAADKNVSGGYKYIGELSFLKRGFTQLPEFPGIILPKLRKKTIHEMVNWIHPQPGIDDEECLRTTVEEAIWFSFFHGRDFFEEFVTKINKALNDSGARSIEISYRACFMRLCEILYGATAAQTDVALYTNEIGFNDL